MNAKHTSPSNDIELQSLETHLSRTLKRVAPPNGMVERLRSRVQMPSRAEVTLRLTDWRRLFFVFGGVMSGMFLLITLARAFYYLSGRSRA